MVQSTSVAALPPQARGAGYGESYANPLRSIGAVRTRAEQFSDRGNAGLQEDRPRTRAPYLRSGPAIYHKGVQALGPPRLLVSFRRRRQARQFGGDRASP